jgi:hypothetical protein
MRYLQPTESPDVWMEEVSMRKFVLALLVCGTTLTMAPLLGGSALGPCADQPSKSVAVQAPPASTVRNAGPAVRFYDEQNLLTLQRALAACLSDSEVTHSVEDVARRLHEQNLESRLNAMERLLSQPDRANTEAALVIVRDINRAARGKHIRITNE